MAHAITKMELHVDGEHVTLHYKIGTTQVVKIKNMYKKHHEKELVQTFEEPFLFPVEIGEGKSKKTSYFYGNGQEAIKNGEIFRAIINGRSIKI